MRNFGWFALLMGAFVLWLSGCRVMIPREDVLPVKHNWDDPHLWTINTDGKSQVEMKTTQGRYSNALEAVYTLKGNHGYFELKKRIDEPGLTKPVLAFFIQAESSNTLELKLLDADGSVFWRTLPLKDRFTDWTLIVLDLSSVEYAWGGDNTEFSRLTEFQIAVSGTGSGVIRLDEVGLAEPGTRPTLSPVGALLDPDCDLPGIGIRQRRAAELIPEDPLVLEWLKQIQDTSTPEKQLLGSMEDRSLQTFNNALCAMAFIIKGEKERAERILDFFAAATDRNNKDPKKQNFFLNGEARGFFQNVERHEKDGVPVYEGTPTSDRWMGDMVWMLFTTLYYEKTYANGRYDELNKRMIDLVTSWYTDSPDGIGGYVRHGWRKGDQYLHESFGHDEGNIDAYALFRMIGRDDLAAKVRQWLDKRLRGITLPLDLYTWRVMAYGTEAADLLDIPDCDLRYRKTVTFNGKQAVGPYSSCDPNVNNIWLDGLGHMACAYFAVDNEERGNFYANQMDAFLIDRDINGVKTRGIPYSANGEGGYAWIRFDRGFASPAAWYIFAKNKINPMTAGE